MDNFVLRPNKTSYVTVCDYLDSLGFNILDASDKENTSIKSKKELFADGLRVKKLIRKNRKNLKKANVVISIGIFSTLWLLFINKLHIVRPKNIIWWAFFIHNKKNYRLIKVFLKLINSPNVKFMVFSECEIDMYSKFFGLNKKSMLYLPYGDWANSSSELEKDIELSDYYFAGGYSNRDYHSLLSCWEKSLPDEKLVVIGSKNNADLVDFDSHNHNENIKIMLDAPSSVFDDYLKKAKACILPFKENTGASGQSVMLRCMRLKKLVISTDTDIMREYAEDDSAFLIRDYEKDLVDAINQLNQFPERSKEMISRQTFLYRNKFSYSAITSRLKQIIETIDE